MKRAILVLLMMALTMSALPIQLAYAAYEDADYVMGEYDFDSMGLHLGGQTQIDESDGQEKGVYAFYKGVGIYVSGDPYGSRHKFGLISVNGEKLGSIYDEIYDFSEDLALAFTINDTAEMDRTWVYLNLEGQAEISLEPIKNISAYGGQFAISSCGSFRDGRAWVRYEIESGYENLPDSIKPYGALFAYIDKSGKKILPADKDEYYTANVSDFSDGVAFVTRIPEANQPVTFGIEPINTNGEVLFSPQSKPMNPSLWTRAGESFYRDGYAYVASSNGDCFIDKRGNELKLPVGIAPAGDAANNGMIRIRREITDNYRSFSYGFYDIDSNKVTIEPPFGDNNGTMNTYFSEGLLAFSDSESDLWGYKDKDGKWVITPQFDKAGPFSEDLAWVIKNGKIGYIDKGANTVIPFEYDDGNVYSFRDGYSIARKNGKYIVLRNPLTGTGGDEPVSNVPVMPDFPNYVGIVTDGKAVYNPLLAAEGINNATAAYWQCFNGGKMFKDNGYYDFVYMVDGEVVEEYGQGEFFDADGYGGTNAVFCVKDIAVDGKPNTMINISVRGTEGLEEWVKDFVALAAGGQIHLGFEAGYSQIVANESKIFFPTLEKSLSDIVANAQSDDSKYLIFVNGHSLGAAVANLYVHSLYNRQVKVNNVVGYTFATPLPYTSGYSTTPTNYPIFNILNNDDPVTHVGASGAEISLFGETANMRMGTDMTYFPDDAFRDNNYGWNIDYAPTINLAHEIVNQLYLWRDTLFGLHCQATYKAIVAQGEFNTSWATPGVSRANMLGLIPDELGANPTNPTTRAEFCRAAINFLRKYGYNVDEVTPSLFADTNDTDIGIAAALGITSGTDTTLNLFSPDQSLTREQAATMLRKVMDVIGIDTTPPPSVPWTDSGDISSWARASVDVMNNARIMGGISSTALTFSPKAPYTHEQSIVTLVNLWEYVQK